MTKTPRLVWLDVTVGDTRLQPLWDCVHEHVQRLVEPDFHLTLVHCKRSGGGIRHPSSRVVQDAITLAEARRQAVQADAIVIGCWGAPRQALKAALDMPIIGVGEASIMQVRPLAESTAIITVAQPLERAFTADIRALTGGNGFVDKPVRALREPLQSLDLIKAVKDPTELIERFESVANEAVCDGADAVLTGCGYVGPILAAHGYDRLSGYPHIPVIDCTLLTVAAIKTLYEFASNGLVPTQATFGQMEPDTLKPYCSALSRLC